MSACSVSGMYLRALGDATDTFLLSPPPSTLLTTPVNNVGKSHNMPAYLVDVPKDEMLDIVNINVTATLRVTYAVLPGMVQKCVRWSP